MEGAEPKTKTKRVRHCYHRKELYHIFIHDDKYTYSPAIRHQISSKGNYLVIGDIGRYKSIEDIESFWFFIRDNLIAIIDRDNKRIIISTKYSYFVRELRDAIPNDYTIYYTNDTIQEHNILSNTEECLRIHSKYILEEYVNNSLYIYYCILYGNKQNLYGDISKENNNYYYNEILKFIKDNNIKKYKFYKECFNETHSLRIYTNNWSSKLIKIKLPTLYQVVHNTFFTKKQKLFLEQKYFWTKYCYTNSIPFKDVVTYWNQEITEEQAKSYLNLRLNASNIILENCTTWNDYIKQSIEIIRKIHNNHIKDNINKSNKNHEEALEKLNKLNNSSIDDWREHKIKNNNNVVEYERYIVNGRNKNGVWVKDKLYGNNFRFNNTQLRLSKDGKTIETSRYCSVPLDEGIKMYKLFAVLRMQYPNVNLFTPSTCDKINNIKVGIYNLAFIHYKDKITDNRKSLGYKEWLIQIGCHSLWLDDINDFIKYYKLEDKFGIY